MSDTVHVVVYNGRWVEDGWEVGGVYDDEEIAEEAAADQRCSGRGREWHNSTVLECEVRSE